MLPLLGDPRFVFILVIAAFTSLIVSVSLASRPASVETGEVATSGTVSQLLLLVSRFSNFLYAPILATFVDAAAVSGDLSTLWQRFQWILAAGVVGSVLAWLLMDSAVELSCRYVWSLQCHGTPSRVLIRFFRPASWAVLSGGLRKPKNLSARWSEFASLKASTLGVNAVATAIWSVGLPAAFYVSAAQPEVGSSALLMSGLVTSIAAISFTFWVDPAVSKVVDNVQRGEQSTHQVRVFTAGLAISNVAGTLLAFLLLKPAVAIIGKAATTLGDEQLLFPNVVLWLAGGISLLGVGALAARLTAVRTREVATALAVYNILFLVTRLAAQVYAPLLGGLKDGGVVQMVPFCREILWSSAVGALIGLLTLSLFVRLCDHAVVGRNSALKGPIWKDLSRVPKAFILSHAIATAVQSCALLAALCASQLAGGEVARTCVVLSSVVNGLATILACIVVEPTLAQLTDEGVKTGPGVMRAAIWCLGVSTVCGLLLSQLFLHPATLVIVEVAKAI